jgi:NAD(P)H-dependent flavin oxidoreductase YrpB (nitropropane dioxygenase family)
MRTQLCNRLGIKFPIVQAPVGRASGAALAAAVSNAGGLGMLALTWTSPEAAREEIRCTRTLTDKPFGVNLVLAWPQDERLAVCLEEGVKIISFFWGDPKPFVSRVHSAGGVALHTIGCAEDARRAAGDGIDVIVAQGIEAGGHVYGTVSVLGLIPAVVDAVKVPVLAAGGIADGRGLAAVLALGAAGAWIGTRFLVSAEASVHPRYRELLLQANENDTVYTTLFNVGWPDGAPHRVLRNSTFRSWEAAGRPSPGQRPGEGEALATSAEGLPIVRYAASTPRFDVEGDIEALSIWAGQGVGLASRSQPAAQIVDEIVRDARQTLCQLGDAATKM